MNDLVSIIIPVYNSEKYLKKILEEINNLKLDENSLILIYRALLLLI